MTEVTGRLVHLMTTLPSRADAVEMGHAVVEARLAACAQVIGPIVSVYRWEGRVEEAEEHLCLLKCPAATLEAAVAYVRLRHPYDTPELTVVDASWVDQRYLAWAETETAGE